MSDTASKWQCEICGEKNEDMRSINYPDRCRRLICWQSPPRPRVADDGGTVHRISISDSMEPFPVQEDPGSLKTTARLLWKMLQMVWKAPFGLALAAPQIYRYRAKMEQLQRLMATKGMTGTGTTGGPAKDYDKSLITSLGSLAWRLGYRSERDLRADLNELTARRQRDERAGKDSGLPSNLIGVTPGNGEEWPV